MTIEDTLSNTILDRAYKIHTAIGPGLLENVYKTCLAYELKQAGIFLETEKNMPFIYHDVKMDIGYRIDLMVENKVIVEVKNVECFTEIHIAQTLTYMKLTGCKLGLLLNFKTKSLKNGIKRLIL
jgi:GxxExxY protein